MGWGTVDESGLLCTLCPKYECHTLIQCFAFDTSSTKPNPCMNFSHKDNVDSRSQHSLVKFLNIESRYSTHFHMYYMKYNIFCLIAHIQPPKAIMRKLSFVALLHFHTNVLMCEHMLFTYLINRTFMPHCSIIKWQWFDFSSKILCFLIQHLWKVNHRSLGWPVGCEILFSNVCSYQFYGRDMSQVFVLIWLMLILVLCSSWG